MCKPYRIKETGRCGCGANWGFFGHTSYDVTYVCQCCDKVHTISQCTAWPITIFDCDNCGAEMDCSLRNGDIAEALR